MTNLRKLAKGKPCQVRLQGCDGGGETTVLAHVRIVGISGMGIKAPDILGAWACASCHRLADSYKIYELDFLRGVCRTINELIKLGEIA